MEIVIVVVDEVFGDFVRRGDHFGKEKSPPESSRNRTLTFLTGGGESSMQGRGLGEPWFGFEVK